MESAHGSAGDGDEHHGEKWEIRWMAVMEKVQIRKHFHAGQVHPGRHGIRKGSQEHHAQNAHDHDDQGDRKKRIDLSHDSLDGKNGRQKVVAEDNPNPCRNAPARHGGQDGGGPHGEDDAHQHAEHDADGAADPLGLPAQVAPQDFRQVFPFVPQGNHAGKVVVRHSAQNAAENDPQECGRAIQHAHDGAENRPQPCNVQQLDEKNAPARHDHIIHAVRTGHGGSLPGGVRPENPFQHPSVSEITGRQGQYPQNEIAVTVHVGKRASHLMDRLSVHGT